MNATLLASAIVARIRNSMQDSALNQEIMVAGMIREAMDEDWRDAVSREPQVLPDPVWPPKSPEIHC